MSAMSFREPNEVLWRGMRPAHKGNQISTSISVTNEYADVYQVPAGELACINTIVVNMRGGVDGRGIVIHTHSDNTNIAVIWDAYLHSTYNFSSVCITFPEPLELTDQEKIRIYSAEADHRVICYVKGRHE